MRGVGHARVSDGGASAHLALATHRVWHSASPHGVGAPQQCSFAGEYPPRPTLCQRFALAALANWRQGRRQQHLATRGCRLCTSTTFSSPGSLAVRLRRSTSIASSTCRTSMATCSPNVPPEERETIEQTADSGALQARHGRASDT